MRKVLSYVYQKLLFYLENVFGILFFKLFWDIKGGYDPNISLKEPHRLLLINEIGKDAPFESALEIGCSSGVNLFLLKKRYSNTKLYGCDISKSALKKAREYFNKNYISNFTFICGSTDNLNTF